MNYFGLPGLVLAVYNNRFHFVYLAKKIIPQIPEIVTSKQTPVITLEKFQELQKSRVNIKDNQLEIRKFQSF
jgi:GLPGLI family protein